MINVTQEMVDKAKDLIANSPSEAVGYRLKIRVLYVDTEMEAAEKAKFETLAKAGFETKTEKQADKLSKGSHYGILVSKGEFAFKADQLGGADWVNEGDVLVFDRYAGVDIEEPPGSGEIYRYMNDESILGRKEVK